MTTIDIPIYIPSKGRPNGTTMQLLYNAGIPFKVVVEQKDVSGYGEQWGFQNVIVLAKENQGIGYARKSIIEMATEDFWMMDDDLHTFYVRDSSNKLQKSDVATFLKTFLAQIQQNCLDSQAVIGCKNTTFAVPKTSKVTWCTDLAHILYIRPDKVKQLGVTYDENHMIFEDVRFLLELGKKNPQSFVRLNQLIYYTVPSGRGLYGGVDYSNNAKQKALALLIKDYPCFVEVMNGTTKHGQPKYRIHWKRVLQLCNDG